MYMSTKTISPRLTSKQVVVMKIGRRNLVGTVCNIKPVGKTYLYDVAGEDGKIYYEMYVDQDFNHTIDTRLTKMYCDKHGINSSMITAPITEVEMEEFVTSDDDVAEEVTSYEDEGVLYEFNEDE